MKSPPELWAELSELGSLARHLGEFGEIRITKVDPESRVEWEADRASGTVRLEPSGWGTRVVLTIDTPEPEPVVPEEPQPEAVAGEPEPEAAEPEPEPVRRGWLARLFRRDPVGEEPSTSEPLAAEPVEPSTPPAHEPPAQAAEPLTEVEPTELPRDRAFGTIEWETPVEPVEEEAAPTPLQPDEAHAVLTGVLDTLGAAHHRPFSRP